MTGGRDIKFGALATPCGIDWDGDGDQDILCGNTAGYIAFLENLGGSPPKWAAPKLLKSHSERKAQGSHNAHGSHPVGPWASPRQRTQRP